MAKRVEQKRAFSSKVHVAITAVLVVLALGVLVMTGIETPDSVERATSTGRYADPMGPISIEAELDDRGVLHVTETRTTTNLTSRDYFRWTFPAVDGIGDKRFAYDPENFVEYIAEGQVHKLVKSDNARVISSASAREPYSYYIDTSGGEDGFESVYIFADSDAQASSSAPVKGPNANVFKVVLHYDLSGFVQLHDDVADLQWEFIGEHWKRAASGVTVTLLLPAVEGSDVPVAAWGSDHTSLNVTVKDTGGAIRVKYTMDAVPYHEAQNMRVTFPASLIASGALRSDGRTVASDIAEHERRVSGNRTVLENFGMFVLWTFLIVAVISIVMSFALSYRVRIDARDVGKRADVIKPSGRFPSTENPAFLSYVHLASKGREWMAQGLAAGLMDLACKGAVVLQPDNIHVRLVREYGAASSGGPRRFDDAIEEATYGFFEGFADEDGVIDTASFGNVAASNAETFVDWCKSWVKAVEGSEPVKRYGILDFTKEAASLRTASFYGLVVVALVLLARLYGFSPMLHIPQFTLSPQTGGEFLACVVGLTLCGVCFYILHREKKVNAFFANKIGCRLLDRLDSFSQWLSTDEAADAVNAMEADQQSRYLALSVALDVKNPRLSIAPLPELDEASTRAPSHARQDVVHGSAAPAIAGVAGLALVSALYSGIVDLPGLVDTAYATAHAALAPSSNSRGGGYGCGGGGCGGGCGGCGG